MGTDRQVSLVKGQDGRASVVALATTAAMYFFVLHGADFIADTFGQNAHPAIYFGALGILVVIAAFSLGCALHLKFIGSKSGRALFRDIHHRVCSFEAMLTEVKDQLTRFEQEMIRRPGSTPRRAMDCLGYARKISQALERRLVDVRELMSYRTELDLIDAYDLLRKRLNVQENSLSSVIDSDPVPAIDPIDWEPTLRRLIAQIENDLRPLAA